MPDWKDILENTKVNIDKYGFFFWLILFGFVEIIFAIIHSSHYIALGILFCVFGMLGYLFSDLLDRISWASFKAIKKDADGKDREYAKTPWWFHGISFVLKLLIIGLLFFAINSKYDFF